METQLDKLRYSHTLDETRGGEGRREIGNGPTTYSVERVSSGTIRIQLSHFGGKTNQPTDMRLCSCLLE